jgi:hypothetical protein
MSSEKAPKLPVKYRVAGAIGNIVFESIFYEGDPAFLTYDGDKFQVAPKLVIPDKEVLLPMEEGMFPYRPYALTKESFEGLINWTPNKVELYNETYREFKTFYDVDDAFRFLEATATLLSYQQHKAMTLPIIDVFGEKDSGKTMRCMLQNYLCYRPLFSVSLPSADIYTFLGQHERGLGTIIEDEIKGLEKDTEKLKIHLSGYKRDCVIPRVSFTPSGRRIQEFYRGFALRFFAGREPPKNDALLERCIIYQVVKGFPERDEFTDEDVKRFDQLRLKLLFWRMKTYFEPLPNIELPFGGRVKEIWKPLLQIAHGTNVYNVLLGLARRTLEEKEEEVKGELEYWVAKAVIDAYCEVGGKPLTFEMIWGYLVGLLEGEVIEDGKMRCEQFGIVTKNLVGRRLGKKGIMRGVRKTKQTDSGTAKVYEFDRNWLIRVARGYGFKDAVDKLLSLPTTKAS